ncbi:MAG: NRDE family protein [Gemmatimonadota bacterium]
MCTLSWRPERDGYVLLFNRDERRARAPALPPERRVRAGVSYVAPIDGDHGGTWVGVNESGITTGLLNRYQARADTSRTPPVSRGLLVAELLDSASVAEVANRLRNRSLAPFQPFIIASVETGAPVALFDWDGSRLVESSVTEPGIVRVSSGVTQSEADRSRRAVLAQLIADAGGLTEAVLVELHRSHLPERGPLSVCMHREEASTVSRTLIRVTGDTAEVEYVPGPPGETEPLPAVVLARRQR